MSRDANGTYTLPGGNPVVTGTTISSAWANSTFNDVASALTDSLSRSGLGSMTSPLKLSNGSIGLPSLSWGTETTAGLYRAGAADFRWALGGTDFYTITSSTFSFVKLGDGGNTPSMEVANALPTFNWRETDAAADTRIWGSRVQAGVFQLGTVSDAGSFNAFLSVSRTTVNPNIINFLNGQLQYGGIEVGYRGMPFRQVSTNDNTVAADNGIIIYVVNSGVTFTIDTDFPINAVITIMNASAGNITVAESLSGNMVWLNGSGSLTGLGSRTIASAGLATVWRVDVNHCYIWGTGLT